MDLRFAVLLVATFVQTFVLDMWPVWTGLLCAAALSAFGQVVASFGDYEDAHDDPPVLFSKSAAHVVDAEVEAA